MVFWNILAKSPITWVLPLVSGLFYCTPGSKTWKKGQVQALHWSANSPPLLPNPLQGSSVQFSNFSLSFSVLYFLFFLIKPMISLKVKSGSCKRMHCSPDYFWEELLKIYLEGQVQLIFFFFNLGSVFFSSWSMDTTGSMCSEITLQQHNFMQINNII